MQQRSAMNISATEKRGLIFKFPKTIFPMMTRRKCLLLPGAHTQIFSSQTGLTISYIRQHRMISKASNKNLMGCKKSADRIKQYKSRGFGRIKLLKPLKLKEIKKNTNFSISVFYATNKSRLSAYLCTPSGNRNQGFDLDFARFVRSASFFLSPKKRNCENFVFSQLLFLCDF